MNLIDQYDIPPEILEDIKKIASRDVHLLMEDIVQCAHRSFTAGGVPVNLTTKDGIVQEIILALAFTRSIKLISITEE